MKRREGAGAILVEGEGKGRESAGAILVEGEAHIDAKRARRRRRHFG